MAGVEVTIQAWVPFFFQLTETESTQATADIYEKEASIQVDYGPLREDLKVI